MPPRQSRKKRKTIKKKRIRKPVKRILPVEIPMEPIQIPIEVAPPPPVQIPVEIKNDSEWKSKLKKATILLILAAGAAFGYKKLNTRYLQDLEGAIINEMGLLKYVYYLIKALGTNAYLKLIGSNNDKEFKKHLDESMKELEQGKFKQEQAEKLYREATKNVGRMSLYQRTFHERGYDPYKAPSPQSDEDIPLYVPPGRSRARREGREEKRRSGEEIELP